LPAEEQAQQWDKPLSNHPAANFPEYNLAELINLLIHHIQISFSFSAYPELILAGFSADGAEYCLLQELWNNVLE